MATSLLLAVVSSRDQSVFANSPEPEGSVIRTRRRPTRQPTDGGDSKAAAEARGQQPLVNDETDLPHDAARPRADPHPATLRTTSARAGAAGGPGSVRRGKRAGSRQQQSQTRTPDRRRTTCSATRSNRCLGDVPKTGESGSRADRQCSDSSYRRHSERRNRRHADESDGPSTVESHGRHADESQTGAPPTGAAGPTAAPAGPK
jgi:hypothetical protein